jgi:hypothetical protein
VKKAKDKQSVMDKFDQVQGVSAGSLYYYVNFEFEFEFLD